jgi:hypothetical protein
MIQGSCLCGGIRFEIDESRIHLINNCYCVNCRKVSGAAYGTFVQMPGSGFRWISGEELVATFESSPGNHRAFCKVCGSRAPQSRDFSEYATVPAGSLDGDPGVKPHVNMFTASKAAWHTIEDSLPSVPDRGTPEFWTPLLEKIHGLD